ncbi:hypothetical protein DITRI_Ditri14bG0049200 [Diplodiscus trichospermus]
MEEKTTTLSHDSAVDKGKEPVVNTENNSPADRESPDVQAAEETGALGSAEGSAGSNAISSRETVNKKKRSARRPRKEEDGTLPTINGTSEAFPPPSSSKKRGQGRPKGSGKWQAFASFDGLLETAGGSMIPHVLLVYKGEDIVDKIRSLHERASRAVCVLTATGPVSKVTLLLPGSHVGTLTRGMVARHILL